MTILSVGREEAQYGEASINSKAYWVLLKHFLAKEKLRVPVEVDNSTETPRVTVKIKLVILNKKTSIKNEIKRNDG